MRNYVLYGKTSFDRWLLYAYLDVEDNLAAGVLAKHGVRAKLLHTLIRENEEYILVQVKVRREDRQAFLDAMGDLKNKMLIFGHRDYESHGGELIRELEDSIIEEALQDGKLMKRMGLDGKNIIIVDGEEQEAAG